jgi:hypothetical protein
MAAPSPPFCAVRVEGEELTDLVVRLRVDESDARADRARILFGDSLLVLCDVLHEGQAIEIELGRADEHAVVFRGLATSVTATFPPAGAPTVELVAHDRLILLSMEARTRVWSNTSVSAIVKEVARDHQLQTGTVAPGDDASFAQHTPLAQVAETDLALLERLGAAHDAKLFVEHGERDDTLSFVSTATLAAAEPIEQSLAHNSTLGDFRASFDAWAAEPAEAVVSTDPGTGDRVADRLALLTDTGADWSPDATRIARLGAGRDRVTRLLAASAGARSRVQQSRRVPPRLAGVPARASGDRSGITGDRLRPRGQSGQGRAGGSIWLRPRARVRIQGYGGRWSGVWTLATVRHEVDLATRRYTTSFTCVR